MQHNAPKLFEDIRDACAFILDSIAGKTLDDFHDDRLLYQAVERNFEIIGEAIHRLKRNHPNVMEMISDYSRIITFRNILVHGYDIIDRKIIWHVIHDNIPILKEEMEKLLRSTKKHS